MGSNFANIEELLKELALNNKKLDESTAQLEQEIAPSSASNIDAILRSVLQKQAPLVAPEDLENIKGVQTDLGLRFQEGFLDPSKIKTVTEKVLERKFPDKKPIVVDSEGEILFSLDGSNFFQLDPRKNDFTGEVAEQVGRFIEPATDIAAGVFGGPGAIAGTAAGFQSGRELLESGAGDQQSLGNRLSDIALKAGGAVALDKLGRNITQGLGSLLGRGARQRTRELAGAVTPKGGTGTERGLVNQAGDILTEQATRDIEENIIKGSDPVKFSKFLQNRASKFVDKLSSEANKAFKAGRELANKESFTGAKANILNQVQKTFNQLSTDKALTQSFTEGLEDSLSSAADSLGKDSLDLTKLSPKQVIAAREFVTEFSNKVTNMTDLNKNALVSFKTGLNDALESQAAAGSRAAEQYVKGISKIRELNTRFPDHLQKKVLGKEFQFPSQFQEVTPDALLDKFKKTTFSSSDLQKIGDITGISARPSAKKLAGKNLLTDLLQTTGKPEEGAFLRLKDLPQDVLEQAKKFKSFSSLDEAQKAGFKLDPDMFTDFVTGKNTLDEGTSFNLRAVDQALKARRGLSPVEILSGGTAPRELISEGAKAARLQQGKIRDLTDPAFNQIGRNVIPLEQLPAVGKVSSDIATTLGDTFIPGGKEALLSAAGQSPEVFPDLLRASGGATTGAVLAISELLGSKDSEDITQADLQRRLQQQQGAAARLLSR